MLINLENELFCIDTSTFITMEKYYPPSLGNDLWNEFDTLFEQGNIISHNIVFEEITTISKYKDHLTKWILPKRNYFKSFSKFQIQYVPQIIKQFPGLIDAKCEKDQADPWLIALAIEMDREQPGLFHKKQIVYVVSEESKSNSIKIPAVAKHYGLKTLNFVELCQLFGGHLVF